MGFHFISPQIFIFAKVFRRRDPSSNAMGTTDDILRAGTDIIAAGYCLYGAATELVISYGKGTYLI